MPESKIIQKAFNDGYLLAKHQPKLSAQIQKGFKDKEHPYAQGFSAGVKEMEKEREKHKSKFLDRLKSMHGEPQLGKSKDGREKDIGMDIDL